MPSSLGWAFIEGVSAVDPGDGTLSLRGPGGDVPLRGLSPGMQSAVRSLEKGASDAELSQTVVAEDGEAKLPVLYYYISRLAQRALLSRSVNLDGTPIATAMPISRWAKFKTISAGYGVPYTLSRFALIRRDGDTVLLESPVSHAKVTLTGWQGAAIAAEMGKPCTMETLASRLPGIPEDVIAGFVELLLSIDMASEIDGEGQPYEDADVARRQWEFHDLLFHSRSRMGRHNRPIGGTFRFRETIPPLPALKAPMSEEFVELFTPDIEALKRDDVPFTAVMESRASIRHQAEQAINDKQLGEFLYRVARTKQQVSSHSGEYAFRVYPGAGGEYELELYPAIYNCDGIAPGLYHYAPAEHRLYKVAELDDRLYTLLGFASSAAMREELPEVLFILSARFQRVSWKYESISYSIILKDVGVLLQTMYLVATAMSLAPCAIGSGDSDLFATIANTDYYVETSVGEFILGAKPADVEEHSGAELADRANAQWG